MKALLAILALLVVLGLGWFLYSSPTAPAEMTDAEVTQIEAEVLSAGDQWLAAVNEANPDVFLELFDPSGTHATDGYHYANYEDWSAHVRRLFSSWEDVNWAWTSTRVEVFASDAAMFVGYAEGTLTRTGRDPSNVAPGATLLMKNAGGAWKIIYQGTAFRPISTGGG
jgi:uncharacterized protein (TIGR02246 family)